MNKKGKIINIMSQSPAYKLFRSDPRPEISWDTADGQWFGIWGLDWADLIGKEILKLTNEFEYEVWQPDLRVDKIYSHTFSNGLTHRLFPAVKKQKFYGLKPVEHIVSQSLYDNLLGNNQGNNVIVHLNGIDSGISRGVLALSASVPIIVQFLGEVKSPLQTLFRFKKNLPSKFNDIEKHFLLKRIFKKVDVVGFCSERSKEILQNYFSGEMEFLPIGVNFDSWKNRSEKSCVRKELGLADGIFVLLSSCRLNGLKQIDRMISVLERTNLDGANFQYVVTGHGDTGYERYLALKGERLVKQGKLRFVGFVPEDKLVDYYDAADLFVSVSLSEGGPISAVKAMAVHLPVFSTDTGSVAELLSSHSAGVVVPKRDYDVWEHELSEILRGRKVRTLDRNIVKSIYHWPNVAERYRNIYKELFTKYFDKEGT